MRSTHARRRAAARDAPPCSRTCSSPERPSGAVGSGLPDGVMRIAARSMKSSDPLTTPSNVRPSMRVTVTLAAFFTTCAFVMIRPVMGEETLGWRARGSAGAGC
eukprot:scaffold18012_cov117-Isochrysis_galbana.AAC.4